MPKSKKFPVINYTSRDFNSIKNDLVEYAKRYYPNTFQDFNDASFGSLMMDTVAYVGDILSFYLDYQANESFLTNSIEHDNIVKLARQMGYKYASSGASSGLATFFILCPANSNGIGPDLKYTPVLSQGTRVASGAASFVLVEDVDFSDPANEVVVAEADENNTPTYYAIKATGIITSGTLVQEDVSVGSFEQFRNIELETENITSVISIIDAQGHEYFEVDHLSQNVIYTSVRNTKSDKHFVSSVMVPIIVPRRFVVERMGKSTIIQFGYGSDSEIRTNSVADPSDVIMDLHGKTYISDRGFDPNKLMSTDKFGIAPSNTMLTVILRINDSSAINAASNTITEVVSSNFSFTDRSSLDDGKVTTVIGSLEVFNEEPIIGDTTTPIGDELKHRIRAHFATQNRAVTAQDYKALIYAMPKAYGQVKRCMISQDPDSFRRNLNLFVVSQAPNLSLIPTTGTIKENLKTWIGRYKMINDTIDVLGAKIVNIGVDFKVVSDMASENAQHSLLRQCVQALMSRVFFRHFEIGEPVDISSVYTVLNSVPGVIDTVDVNIVNKTGGIYSDVPLSISQNLSSDGRRLYLPEDYIAEIKQPDLDIQGIIE